MGKEPIMISSRGTGRPPATSPRPEPGCRRAPPGTRSGMPKFDRPKSVPKGMQATYDAVVRLTDEFCDRHLNAEYGDLARDMTAALCRKRPSPLASGQPRTWAGAILYELALQLHLCFRCERCAAAWWARRQSDQAITWAGGMRRWASRMAMRRSSWTDQRIRLQAVACCPLFLGAAPRSPGGGSRPAWQRPASRARHAG